MFKFLSKPSIRVSDPIRSDPRHSAVVRSNFVHLFHGEWRMEDGGWKVEEAIIDNV